MSESPAAPIARYQWWYGRDEPPTAARLLRAGPVTARLVDRDLRNVRFGGVEIAQRIYVAVRDRNWNTVPGDVSDLTLDEGDDRFAVRFTVRHRQHDIDFTWRGEILGTPDGTIRYGMDAVAGADMAYKLIGLNVHHGMRDFAGRPCRGAAPEGSFAAVFPTDVAPQLVVDDTEVAIFPAVESLTADLAHGVGVRFDFEGDTFEFEDQRNWTDASFKSQSYPPRRGGMMTIRAGERVWQSVTITPSGSPPRAPADDGPIRIALGDAIGSMPPIGLGMASDGAALSERAIALLRTLRLAHLRADLRLSADYAADLARAAAAATALECGLELALHVDNDADNQLARLADRLDANGARIDRVLVFHDDEPATDRRWVALARRRLGAVAPKALFAGGTNANFCELNRFRPEGAADDGLVYAITPQIHAFDEQSLTENLAGQAETVRTARAFGGDRPVIVSPVTLKPRFNSVASSDEPEPAAGELPSQVDPRQMSLFGAGWTVGSLARLIESGVAAATYYETTGWRGVIAGDAPCPDPSHFPSRPGMVFPMYHVFADLAEFAAGAVIRCASSDPHAVAALAAAHDGTLHLLVANLTPEPRTVAIDRVGAGPVMARRLHADNAALAAFDPDQFRAQSETLVADGTCTLTLAPFEVVRLRAPFAPAPAAR